MSLSIYFAGSERLALLSQARLTVDSFYGADGMVRLKFKYVKDS